MFSLKEDKPKEDLLFNMREGNVMSNSREGDNVFKMKEEMKALIWQMASSLEGKTLNKKSSRLSTRMTTKKTTSMLF